MKRLVTAGLIENNDKLWSLTQKGRTYLSDFSLETMRETKMPKLCVMIGAECNEKVAVYRWNRAPHTGRYTVPYGRWHRGDTLAEAYQAEAVEKYSRELPLEEFRQQIAYSVDPETVHEVHIPCLVSLEAAEEYPVEKGTLTWVLPSELATLAWASRDHRNVAMSLYGVSDGGQ